MKVAKIISMLAFFAASMVIAVVVAVGQPKRADQVKPQWYAPRGTECPIFRFGADSTDEEASDRCTQYCEQSKKCKACEKHEGKAYPTCGGAKRSKPKKP